MKYSACLVLLSLGLLPACFASSSLDREGCEANPCTGTVVEFCDGTMECEELPWCGTTVFCEYEAPGMPIVPPCGPRPACADSVEVASCEGWDTCFGTEWCGQTLYCASNNICNALPPTCAPDEELSDVPCSPAEIGCTPMMHCESDFYCRPAMNCADPIFEPCAEAMSTVWGTSAGQCPDFDGEGYCYETNYCGELRYCITACAPGDEEVFHPSECVDQYDCYPSNPLRDDLAPSWCQGGGGPSCRAVPTCEGGQEIPLNAGCDDEGYCEFRSLCSATIQCYFGPVLG